MSDGTTLVLSPPPQQAEMTHKLSDVQSEQIKNPWFFSPFVFFFFSGDRNVKYYKH